jgi:hypothetical protein
MLTLSCWAAATDRPSPHYQTPLKTTLFNSFSLLSMVLDHFLTARENKENTDPGFKILHLKLLLI